MPGRDEHRSGLISGASAYLLWGAFPLYWPLLKPAGTIEILAQRMVWSLLTMLVLLLALRRFRAVREVTRDRRRTGLLALAACLVSVNWGVYIFATNTGHVVETSLGYFINPLLSILLGVVVLGERLRPAQWGAVAIGARRRRRHHGRLRAVAVDRADARHVASRCTASARSRRTSARSSR